MVKNDKKGHVLYCIVLYRHYIYKERGKRCGIYSEPLVFKINAIIIP